MCIVVCVREWVREFMCIEGAIHTPIRVRRHTSKAYAQKVCVYEAGKEGERESPFDSRNFAAWAFS